MKRGRKPMYLCPDAGELRHSIWSHCNLADVCRFYGVQRKTLYRWMTECGMQLPPKPKQRPRGVTPRYVRLANLASNGRRKACKLYIVWDGMWARCINPRANSYNRYGGRGITVCDEWREYDAFRAWAIANGYRKGLSLDRHPNGDGDYEPSNCRWTDASTQQWATCRTIFLTINGVTRALPEWAALMRVTPGLFRSRRREGWTDEQIVLTPKGAPRIGYTPKPCGRKPKSRVGEGFSANQSVKP